MIPQTTAQDSADKLPALADSGLVTLQGLRCRIASSCVIEFFLDVLVERKNAYSAVRKTCVTLRYG